MSKKVDLTDIIARKKQGEFDKLTVQYYDSKILGGKVEIRKIPLGRYLDLIEADTGQLNIMNAVIYECCPMFKGEHTKELMEAFDVHEPIELPSVVFQENMVELGAIFEMIGNFYGLDRMDDDIKN